MVTCNIDFFDLRKIMESGQIFRMYEPSKDFFVVYSGSRRLEMKQKGSEVVFFCEDKDFEEYWTDYFDLKRDYGEIVGKAVENYRNRNDRGSLFLMNACEYGAGIRVLRQDLWEMMVSFIISQQKQIPSIRKCIEALCERFGEKHTSCSIGTDEKCVWYGFPSPKSIVSKGPDGLKGLSLGYRERYIYETAVKFLSDSVDVNDLLSMSPSEARKYLISFTGIGEKVADCIGLFGLGFRDAFPVDVHIKDILFREFVPEKDKERIEIGLKVKLKTDDLPRKKVLESLSYNDYLKIIEENFDEFKGVRGIVQQWIFAYEINRDS